MKEKRLMELKKKDIDSIHEKIYILLPFLLPAILLANNIDEIVKIFESISKYLG